MSNGYLVAAEADLGAARDIGEGFGLEVVGAAGDHDAISAALVGAANVGLLLSQTAARDEAFVALLRALAVRLRGAQLIVLEAQARAAFPFLPEAWPTMSFEVARERSHELLRRRQAPPTGAPAPLQEQAPQPEATTPEAAAEPPQPAPEAQVETGYGSAEPQPAPAPEREDVAPAPADDLPPTSDSATAPTPPTHEAATWERETHEPDTHEPDTREAGAYDEAQNTIAQDDGAAVEAPPEPPPPEPPIMPAPAPAQSMPTATEPEGQAPASTEAASPQEPPIMPAPAPTMPAPAAPGSPTPAPVETLPPQAPPIEEPRASEEPVRRTPAHKTSADSERAGAMGDRQATAAADATAFAPKKLRRGTPELVRVVVHQPKDLAAVIKAARQVDPRAEPAPQGMSIGDIAIGAHVGVSLEVRGGSCDGGVQRRVWAGAPIDFSFPVEALSDVKQVVVLARVFVDDAQIGVLAFTRPVIGADKKPEGVGDKARLKRHKRVFLSYSSTDRETVAAIATAYRMAGVEHFWDRASLASGEEWGPRLRREIDRADLFHLCWSKSAAKSEWVEKEAAHALTRRRRSNGKTPDITVQMLDGPPWAKHPDSLDSINFDDFVRAAIVGYARGDGEN